MSSLPYTSKRRTASQSRPEVRGEGQLLQAMIAHWIHEDQLYWTQIRHLLVLQVAILASWFALGLTWLAVFVTSAAVVLCALIYRLARIIAKNRDSNLDTIHRVSKNLVSQKSVCEPEVNIFRFATHELGDRTDEGRFFQSTVFWMCLTVNMGMAAMTAVDLAGYKTVLPQLHPKFSSLKVAAP
jgi:hypothetical protein